MKRVETAELAETTSKQKKSEKAGGVTPEALRKLEMFMQNKTETS